MEKREVKFIITTDILNALGNYLATKPWGEVQQLIAALQQLQQLKEGELDNEKNPNT